MTNKNQKLELTWIGKDNQPKLDHASRRDFGDGG